ncbi:RTA1 like protein-domain-containing protein [Aspergillus lucknowensis]|uniref:RTA1 like protein-domain-containing protein n=1 Tax=Aspergillus lucknowensis TaxID=176173 RepID=A0ABR4LKB8_9EURO
MSRNPAEHSIVSLKQSSSNDAMPTFDRETGIYEYKASHVLPIVFGCLLSLSLGMHIYQNFHYRFWKITFWMFWGSLVYVVGWILRAISSYNPQHLNLYIAGTIFIYAAPPIFSASAYNILGRIMHYIPMFAWLNPNRTVYFFVYIGVLVEGLTAAGGARIATGAKEVEKYRSGAILMAISVILQCVVEVALVGVVASLHRKCARQGMAPRNLRFVFYTLYGTSALVLVRCLYRAVESLYTIDPPNVDCNDTCQYFQTKEWLLYAFDAAPMVLFAFWINLMHPGRYLPRDKTRYLDFDGVTERMGPGWLDSRPKIETFIDPLDLAGIMQKNKHHTKYWEEPLRWLACEDAFTTGTASNVKRRSRVLPKLNAAV